MSKKTTDQVLAVFLLVICPLLSGCFAMVAKGNLEKVENFPDMSHFTNKPAVHFPPPQHQLLKEVVARVTEELKLFRSITFDVAEAQQTDYTISMNMTNKEEEAGTARTLVAGVNLLCMTPFGVPLPYGADRTYTLTATIKDRAGTTLGTYNIAESVTIYGAG